MNCILSFLAGLLFANGIPHFVHGISGEDFHNPSLHRFFKKVPSPTFNVIWGLLNFGFAFLVYAMTERQGLGQNAQTLFLASGFIFTSVGLSVYFKNRKKEY